MVVVAVYIYIGTNQKMGEEQCHMDTNVAYGTHRDVIMIRGN